jgi:hypothetical protein
MMSLPGIISYRMELLGHRKRSIERSRQAKRGEVPVADASRLASILAVNLQCVKVAEETELADQIAELQRVIAPKVVPFDNHS